jgi:pimeloyl-ACP methyl ester carboxylesterase
MHVDKEAIAKDGTRLWYRVHPAPSGTPLVLSNGAACSIHYWPLLVKHFEGRIPIVLWDYRGHGRSARAPLDTYEIPWFARDLVSVLDAERIEEAVLVGHSMGVQVILDAWRQAPRRVAALIPMFGSFGEIVTELSRMPFVPSAVDGFLAQLERFAGPVSAAVYPALTTPLGVLFGRVVGSNLDLCPPQYLLELMKHIRTLEPELVVRTFRSVVRYSAADILSKIEAPALIFAGAFDKMTPPVLAERMARSMPRAELAVVDHGSHLAMLENPGFVHCRLEACPTHEGAPAAAAPDREREVAAAG